MPTKALLFLTLFLVSLLAMLAAARPVAKSRLVGGRAPVAVELFTSEGCPSCPAADAALRELAVVLVQEVASRRMVGAAACAVPNAE